MNRRSIFEEKIKDISSSRWLCEVIKPTDFNFILKLLHGNPTSAIFIDLSNFWQSYFAKSMDQNKRYFIWHFLVAWVFCCKGPGLPILKPFYNSINLHGCLLAHYLSIFILFIKLYRLYLWKVIFRNILCLIRRLEF